jgi:hypothetical protein
MTGIRDTFSPTAGFILDVNLRLPAAQNIDAAMADVKRRTAFDFDRNSAFANNNKVSPRTTKPSWRNCANDQRQLYL